MMYKLYHFEKVDFWLTVRMRMHNYGKLNHTQTTYLRFSILLHILKTDYEIKMWVHPSAYSTKPSARTIEARYFGTTFWQQQKKTQESLPKFQTTIKEKLLSITNEINYFWIGNIKAKNQFLSETNYSNSIILYSSLRELTARP